MWTVERLTKKQADAIVTVRHYSRRASMFCDAFGLINETGGVEGVVVFGSPPAQIAKHAFKDRNFQLWELTRLVIQTEERNAASFLIAGALRLIEGPTAIVSYADTEWGHAGIVYQAANWIYTGATVSHDSMYIVDGKRVHPRTLAGRGITSPKVWARENGIETVPPQPKHRYFFFCGNKKQKKEMRAALLYPQGLPYPKCEKQMYDAGDKVELNIADVNACAVGLL